MGYKLTRATKENTVPSAFVHIKTGELQQVYKCKCKWKHKTFGEPNLIHVSPIFRDVILCYNPYSRCNNPVTRDLVCWCGETITYEMENFRLQRFAKDIPITCDECKRVMENGHTRFRDDRIPDRTSLALDNPAPTR